MLLSFGKAPFALLVVALLSGLFTLVTRPGSDGKRPDLVFTVFSKEHKLSYERVLPAFEAKHGVRVQINLLDNRALQSRLQAALQSGSEVPDVVELIEPSIGYFTRGPLADVGFTDLTERVEREGLRDRMVGSRFSLWSSRGRIFAIPHDVHPVALAYRKDLVAAAGIDVAQLDTWDKFLEVGRKFSVDHDGDGIPERYLIDLPTDGSFGLQTLLWQAGGGYFTEDGKVRFDDEIALRTVLWYARSVRGPNRIAVSCGWGQTLARAATDGLALFYVAPDWRTRQFELDMPNLDKKFGIMPLPAWTPGGRRTSTWGGTGIAITKACRNQELAWELVKELYLDTQAYAERYSSSYILPPIRQAWTLEQLRAPNAFYDGLPLGSIYAGLAPDIPDVYVTAYEELARTKYNEAYVAISLRYEASGEAGLEEFARAELARCATYVRSVMARNRFLKSETAP